MISADLLAPSGRIAFKRRPIFIALIVIPEFACIDDPDEPVAAEATSIPHQRSALAVSGRLRRDRRLRGGQLAEHLGLPVLLGAVVGGCWPRWSGRSWPWWPSGCRACCWRLVTLAFGLFCRPTPLPVLVDRGWPHRRDGAPSRCGSINFGSDRSSSCSVLHRPRAISVLVLLVQRGTVGRYLAAMRGSPTAAASLGINLRLRRLTVFAMSAGIAASVARCTGRSSSTSRPTSSPTSTRSSSSWP